MLYKKIVVKLKMFHEHVACSLLFFVLLSRIIIIVGVCFCPCLLS